MLRPKLANSLALLLFNVACVSDPAGHDTSRYGRYALRTINGEALPGVVVENSVARLEFLSGSLRLNRDNSFTDSTDLKVTPTQGAARLVVDEAAGTFRFSADTVFLDSTRGEHYYMVFQVAGSLTQELNGSRLVYRK